MEVKTLETASPLLLTARLRLVAADPHLAAALADFHQRNRTHLAPWEPPSEPGFFSAAGQAQRLRDGAAAFAAGARYRYLLQPIGDPERVIGSIHFSRIIRGAFQCATLDYALAQECEGQALMSEALRTAIAEMFSPRINLHRIQAAFRPENWRSAEILKRLGFVDEGLAADYLFIEGAWQAHRLTALVNKGFVLPAAWRQGPTG